MPQRAVQEMQGVFSVMVVGPEEKVEQRLVMPAERLGSLWVMESGLKAEDRVVVEGLQKVRPGVKVKAQVVQVEEDAEGEGQGEKAPGEKAPSEKAAGQAPVAEQPPAEDEPK